MAFIALLLIQALLVAVTVVLLRPQSRAILSRLVAVDIGREDLTVLGAVTACAAVLVPVGVLLLNGPGRGSVLVVVSVLAAVAAVAVARRLDRPDVRASLVDRLDARLVQAQREGRAAASRAGTLGRRVTSRARRGGGARAGRRR